MKKLSSTSLALLAFSAASYAQAGVGAQIKNGLNKFGTELIIVGAGVLFVAIVLIGINALVTPIQHLKRWVISCFTGGLILIFAEDIVDFILQLAGGGSGY